MKHSSLCVGAILCVLLTQGKAHAQDGSSFSEDNTSKILRIGAKAAGSWNQFSQPGTTFTGSAGAFARFAPLPFLQVQGEILYSVLGGGRRDFERDLTLFDDGSAEAVTSQGPVSSLEYINRHVYLHTAKIPISIRLSPSVSGSMKPSVVLGGSYSYIFSASETRDSYFNFQNGTRVILSDTKENVTADYHNSNIALHGGFELDFNLENEQVFSLGFIFSQGLTDLNKIQNGQPENIERLRSRGMSLNISYSIF